MMHGWGAVGLVASLVGFLFVAGTLIGLVVLAVWLWRRSDAGNRRAPAREYGTAQEILAARYARGEISREEYLEMRDELGH